MRKTPLTKNISYSESHDLALLVDYEKARVVSRTLAQTEAVTLTLFAFDQGEGLSTHAAPGDAMVQVLDGRLLLTIGGKDVPASTGQIVVMPADVPHSLKAVTPVKMLLTLLKSSNAH